MLVTCHAGPLGNWLLADFGHTAVLTGDVHLCTTLPF